MGQEGSFFLEAVWGGCSLGVEMWGWPLCPPGLLAVIPKSPDPSLLSQVHFHLLACPTGCHIPTCHPLPAGRHP